MLIDTHCHLNLPEFNNDIVTVICNAKKAGVKKFIVPGVDLFSSQTSLEMADKYPGVIFTAVGIHPYETESNPELFYLEKLLKNQVVAIGECGLDYHLYHNEKAIGKKDRQKKLFENQLQIALKHNLPIIMHCRDAFDDLFDVLDTQTTMIRGVWHCFSGGLEHLRQAVKRNLFIGIDGNVTYSKQLDAVVPKIPIENLLLETDSPNLTPIPHRGQRNEPKYLLLTAKKIAVLTGIRENIIIEKTTENANRLFHLF
jgi:TatD DNase family protein